MNSNKTLLAVLAGAVVAFVWINISWMVIEWHGIKSVGGQETIGAALKEAAADGAGVYALPAWKDDQGKMLSPDVVAKAAEAGPFAFMVVHPAGLEMSMARSMLAGFAIQVLGAFLLCFLMLMVSGGTGGDFKRRMAIAVCFGLAVGLLPSLSNWNWWHFPSGYTCALIADSLISWSLAGLVMAKILGGGAKS